MYTEALSTVTQQGTLELNVDDGHGRGRGGSDQQPAPVWNSYWFDLSKEALMWFNSEEEARQFQEFEDDVVVGRIPLDRIVRVRVTSQREDSLSVAVQQDRSNPPTVYNLRARDKSTRNLWVHSFHSCVAWLITTITRRQLRAKSTSQGTSSAAGANGRLGNAESAPFARTQNAFDRFNYPTERPHRPLAAHQPININRNSHDSSMDDEMMAMPTVLKERGTNALSYGSFQDVPHEALARGGESQGSASGGSVEDEPMDIRRSVFQRQLTVASGSGRSGEGSGQSEGFRGPSREDFAGLDDDLVDDEEDLFGDMDLGNDTAAQSATGMGRDHTLSLSLNDDDDDGVFTMTGNFDESDGGSQPVAQAQKAQFAAAPVPSRFSSSSSAGKYVPPHLRKKQNGGAPGGSTSSTREAASASAPTVAAAQQLSGVCAIQGSRSKMEDRDLSVDNFSAFWRPGTTPSTAPAAASAASVLSNPSMRHSFYAVFDGHDGVQAAQFAVERICRYATASPHFTDSPLDAFAAAIKTIDKEFLQLAADSNGAIYCGSTVLTVYIRNSTAYVCTVGDSRCMLCRAGTAKELSTVLTPGTPSERARIEAAGGWITEDQELVLARLHHMKLEDPLAQEKLKKKNYLSITTHRVNGTLSVSRALGDPEYKGNVGSPIWMYPEGHSRTFAADLVISDPCVHVEDLEADKDEFIILACDGLWDVMDGQDAVDIIKQQFSSGATATAAAEFVVKKALELGTSDNVSVIVVPLMNTPSSPRRAQQPVD